MKQQAALFSLRDLADARAQRGAPEYFAPRGALVAFIRRLNAKCTWHPRASVRRCVSPLPSGKHRICGLRVANAVLVATLAVPALAAQQEPAPASADYSIKSSVRRVLVDVVVTGVDGKPVADLEEKDFSVTEDGDLQKLLSFDAHGRDSWKQTLPTNLPANTFINLPREAEQGPLYVLLYDLGNSGIAGQMFARRQLARFVAEMPAGTRFAVIALSSGMYLLQGFTQDRQLLAAALDARGQTPHMPLISLSGSPGYLDVLKELAGYLEGLPGRKNVIWVSGDFPFFLFPPLPADIVMATRKELTAIAASQIAVYPVDDSGITAVDQKTVTLNEVAWETGGEAYYNSNDLAGLLNRATSDGATYYTLSYSSTNRKYDGSLRRIEVKVAKTGTRLSYRRQYYADFDGPGAGQLPGRLSQKTATLPTAPEKSAAPTNPLYTFVRHGMPMSHQVLFSVHPQAIGKPRLATTDKITELAAGTSYFRSHAPARGAVPLPPVSVQRYSLAYAVPSRQFHPALHRLTHPHTLELAAAAYDREGHLLSGSTIQVKTAPGAESSYYQVVEPFDVPASAQWICVAVHDLDTGLLGNLEFDLPLAPEQSAR